MTNIKVEEIQYYLNLMLVHLPKAIPVFMAIARREISFNREFIDSYNFLTMESDIESEFDEKVVLQSEAKPALILFADMLFQYQGVLTYHDFWYDWTEGCPKVKVRDKVVLLYPTSKCAYAGTVTSLNPLRCSIEEDGSVITVSNTIRVEKLS
jgi:hypothetical protein